MLRGLDPGFLTFYQQKGPSCRFYDTLSQFPLLNDRDITAWFMGVAIDVCKVPGNGKELIKPDHRCFVVIFSLILGDCCRSPACHLPEAQRNPLKKTSNIDARD